jgi:hypothetical protein
MRDDYSNASINEDEEPTNLYAEWEYRVRLPPGASVEFLTKVFLHLVEWKIAFGVYREGERIIIGCDPSNHSFMPSRWSDGKWYLGQEYNEPNDVHSKD